MIVSFSGELGELGALRLVVPLGVESVECRLLVSSPLSTLRDTVRLQHYAPEGFSGDDTTRRRVMHYAPEGYHTTRRRVLPVQHYAPEGCCRRVDSRFS